MNKTKYARKFIDLVRIHVKAGTGGNGYPKLGGIGGKGGDVYFQGVKDQNLAKIRKPMGAENQWKAECGNPSKHHRIYGDPGKDLIIPVPLGTMVSTDFGINLGDIVQEGDKVLIARGGSGGHSDNQFFGQPGEKRHVQLLLKIISDIGLVGFPNAGKSSLLRAISNAKPRVSKHPFTTLEPTVGLLQYDDQRVISMADLPGLVEGAWNKKGLGNRFLRHIERAKLMLFVVDAGGFQVTQEDPHRSAIETVVLLNKELELYKPELVEKPAVLLFNKIDPRSPRNNLDALKNQVLNIEEIAETMSEELIPERFISFGKILGCSVKYDHKSVLNLKENLRYLLDLYHDKDKSVCLVETRKKIRDQMYEKNLKLL